MIIKTTKVFYDVNMSSDVLHHWCSVIISMMSLCFHLSVTDEQYHITQFRPELSRRYCCYSQLSTVIIKFAKSDYFEIADKAEFMYLSNGMYFLTPTMNVALTFTRVLQLYG